MFRRTKNEHLQGMQGASARITALVQDIAEAGRIQSMACDLRGSWCRVEVTKDGNTYSYEFDHEDHESEVVNRIYQDLYSHEGRA